jgi:hypothetical protein
MRGRFEVSVGRQKKHKRDGHRAHLAAGVMPEVIPVDFERALVVHVHQLVYEGVFHVSFAPESTLAEYRDTRAGNESTRAVVAARLAAQMLRSDGTPRLLETFEHESYSRAWNNGLRGFRPNEECASCEPTVVH